MAEDLKNVVKKVNLLEEVGRISPWDDEHIPEEIVTTEPDMGCVENHFIFATL